MNARYRQILNAYWRMVCIVAFAAAPALASAAAAAEPAAARPLRIGIIGTGNIGGALPTHWAKAGFEPVVVGPLSRAKEFDVDSKVYTRLLTAPELRHELGLD